MGPTQSKSFWGLIFLVVGVTLGQGILVRLASTVAAHFSLGRGLVECLGSVDSCVSWLPYLVVGTHFSGANGASAGVRMGGVLKIYGTVVLFAILFSSAPGESRSAGELAPERPQSNWPRRFA